MKKFWLIALICCLLLPAFAACKDEEPAPSDETGGADRTPAVTTGTEEPDLFPDIDLEGEEINILMSTEMRTYCYAEEEGISQVSDEIYSTYRNVSDKYNVEFVFDFESSQGSNTAKFNSKITNSISRGFGNGYDLIMGQMHSISLAMQGNYRNLANTDLLRLDADYYYQSINDSSNIEGQLYAIAGAYNMDKVSMSIVMFFNKTLHTDLFGTGEYSNLYQLVRNGDWTYEVLQEMTREAYSENGDGEWNEKDRYGLIGTNTGTAALVGSGIVSVIKNAEDKYQVTFYDDHLTTVYNAYLGLFGQDYVKVDGTYDNEPIFTSGNSLFYSSHVSRLGTMNGMTSFKIGVLPFPKYDSQQEDYRTYVNRSEMLFVPANADMEISATIIEYLNYLFLQDVVTAYWDQSLAGRFAADPEDSEMLELARSCVFEDFGLTYTSMLDYFYAQAGEKLMTGEDLTSWWEGVETGVNDKLQALIEDYRELASKGY